MSRTPRGSPWASRVTSGTRHGKTAHSCESPAGAAGFFYRLSRGGISFAGGD